MTDTITVACKMPNGVRLRIFETTTRTGKDGVKWNQNRVLKEFVLAGPRQFADGDTRANSPEYAGRLLPNPQSGYVLNTVDKDDWERWCQQNSDSPLLENHILVCHSKDSAGAAKEHHKQRSGLEPIDPSGDVRVKSLDRRFKVETATDGEAA